MTQLLSARQRAAQRTRLLALAKQPTQELPAIQVQRPVRMPATTRPLLPLDAKGRPYCETLNPYEETQALVQALVERYISLQGEYPAVILLSAFRYLTWGVWQKSYSPLIGVSIPIDYETGCIYEVLVRGEA